MLFRTIAAIFLLGINLISIGQEVSQGLGNSTDEIDLDYNVNKDSGPGVQWGPPSRFVELSYFTTSSFNMTSEALMSNTEDGKATVRKYEEIYGKIKYPIKIKGNTQIIGGLQYRYHEYNFSKPDSLDNELYNILENKHLNRIRLDFYLNHNFQDGRYLVGKSGLHKSGDYLSKSVPVKEILKVYLALVHVWKRNDNLSWGAGFYYSHQGGRNSIYPVLAINYWKNKKWGIEGVIPANFSVILRINEHNFLSFQYNIASTRYLIADPMRDVTDQGRFTLLRRDVQFFVQYQKALYKFIWLSAIVGYNWNYNFDINLTQKRSSPVLVSNQVGASPFGQIGIFLTIPEGVRNKAQEAKEE